MVPVAWKIADQTWQLYLMQDNVFSEGILNIQFGSGVVKWLCLFVSYEENSV